MTSELTLSPEHGVLSLHTGREGLVSKAGHDLTLHVGDWAGVVTYNNIHQVEHIRLVAKLESLVVHRGDGGVKPLSDKDKATIRKEALKTLQADSHPTAVFETEQVVPDGTGYQLSGTVTIAGKAQPITCAVKVTTTDTSRITAETSVLQSASGIKPYSGMLGTLRVRDLVGVKIDLTVTEL